MRLNKVKRTVMATVLAVATAVGGVAGEARAFSFNSGDLVLAIYGNNTEALYNLGAASGLFGPTEQTFNVLSELDAAKVGTNSVQYTMFGYDTTGATYAGTTSLPSEITGTVALTQQFEAMIGMKDLGGFSGNTIAATDASGKSFTTNLNGDGSSNFIGTWPVTMSGSLGNIINVIKGSAVTNAFVQAGPTQLAQMSLGADGVLHVGNNLAPAPVPLPGVVVLFGTGLIGLIGIARRKLIRTEA